MLENPRRRWAVSTLGVCLSLMVVSTGVTSVYAASDDPPKLAGFADNSGYVATNPNPDQVRTLSGKILNMNGQRFILRDYDHNTWYHLDDQNQAGKYLGRTVVVRGQLDTSTGMIHVQEISEEMQRR